MLVATNRHFEPRLINVIRQTVPSGLLPTPTASSATGPGRSGGGGGANLQTRIHEGLSRTASIRLAGNAVVRLQARLMLQRGLIAINNERNL